VRAVSAYANGGGLANQYYERGGTLRNQLKRTRGSITSLRWTTGLRLARMLSERFRYPHIAPVTALISSKVV